MSFKQIVLTLFALCLISMPSSAVLLDNGDFGSPLGPGAGWGVWAGGPVAAIEHTTGGNPGGFVSLNNGAGGWAGWYNFPTIADLNVLGIPAGTTITFAADIKSLGGVLNAAGLKPESWSGGSAIDMYAGPLKTITTEWATYSVNYTLVPEATHLLVSLMNLASDVGGGATAHIGFDNARVLIPGGTPALRPVPIVWGTRFAGNPVLSWTNPDPNNPGDTITADVFILESNNILIEDPNLGPDVIDPGVFQVAANITSESLDLADAGYTLLPNKYYYWAVHITDPSAGTVKGFDWVFLATEDAPPTVVADADQYLVATASPMNLSIGATAWDDKPGYTVQWIDNTNPADKDPDTTITIVNGTAENTTVTLTNAVSGVVTGYYQFEVTVTDSVGQIAVDQMVIGVYATCAQAATADPDDDYDATGDFNGDCKIDLLDFAVFAARWLDCNTNRPDDVTCP